MREIKFRAWWKHPKYLPDGAMFFVGGMIFATPQDGEPEYENCSIPKQIGLMDSVDNSKIGWNDAKECVLMQYTGLKDKNGREIYEGDIVGYYMFLPDETWDGATMVIEYDSENAQFKTPFSDTQNIPVKLATDSIEILGNVYENPGLIPNIK